MKTISADIHTLIKNLSPSERKNFRQNAEALNKGDKPLYLLLFDAIEKQKVYDEEKLLKKLAGKLTSSNISYQKNYLQEAILDYLTTKISNYDIESEWLLMVRKAQIFSQRQMPDAALRMALKALEFAKKNHLLFESAYAQNLCWQMQLRQWTAAEHHRIDEHGQSLNKLLTDLIYNTELIRMYYLLQHATSNVPLAMSHEAFQALANSILKNEILIKSLDENMPFQLRYKATVIHSAIFVKLKMNDEAFAWKQRELELLETLPESLLRANGEYLFALINFCHRCRFAGRFDVFLQYIQKLEKHEPPSTLAAEKKFGLFREWSSYYFQTGDFEKAAAMEKDIACALQNFPDYNDRFTVETLHLNTAASFFHLRKYDDALRNTAHITNSANPGKTFTLHIAAKLLNCMIYFEQKEPHLLEFQLSHLYREILKYDHKDARLRNMISFFKKLNPTLPNAELKTQLQLMQHELSKPNYSSFLTRWFNLRKWVEERVNRI